MIKVVYLVALFIVAMVVVSTAVVYSERRDIFSRTIFKLFGTIAAAIVPNAIFMMTDSLAVAEVCNVIFQASISWLLLFVAEFILRYSNLGIVNEARRKVIYGIVGLNSVIVLLNPIFHHVFTLELAEAKNVGEYFKIASYGSYFWVHFTLNYIIAGAIVLFTIRRAVRTPRGFRNRYYAMLASYAAVIAANIYGMIYMPAIDFTMIAYSIAVMCVYYWTVIYVPKSMSGDMLKAVINSSAMGAAFFETNGKCVSINGRVLEMMDGCYGKSGIDDILEVEDSFRCWLKKGIMREDDEEYSFVKTVRKASQNRDLHYEFSVLRLRDKSGDFIGYFVRLLDRTNDYEEMEEQEYRATHDLLTGIYNEIHFTERVQEVLRFNPNTEFVMISSDIRNFKMANDIFSSDFGDEILKACAVAFRKQKAENVVYARLVKDRFAMLMPKELYNEAHILRVIHDVEEDFTNEFFKLQIKIGVYMIEDHKEPVYVMVDRCNMAIEKIQNSFSQTLGYFDNDLLKKALEKNKIINDFDTALENEEFHIFLQPQTNSSGRVLGAEALVRWIRPEEGMVSPGAFIPVLEDAGLIYKLDLCVWELAAKQLAKWKEMGRDDLYISVNVSAQDQYFLDIYKTFTGLVEKYEISPKKLHIEITETIFVTEVNKHLELLQRLQAYGFEISIDDFGSGYSSLNILKDITADELKIDMVFLQKTANEQRSLDIISSVIAMASKLKMLVVAEGVETEQQLRELAEMNCDVFQGYYFSRPIPVEQFEKQYLAS